MSIKLCIYGKYCTIVGCKQALVDTHVYLYINHYFVYIVIILNMIEINTENNNRKRW